MNRIHRKCKPTFPVTEGERWTVRGIGGEPSERWTVVQVQRDKNGPYGFYADVVEFRPA